MGQQYLRYVVRDAYESVPAVVMVTAGLQFPVRCSGLSF